ncbi:MAG: dihydroneopterin aldolase [Arachnia sp.]
MFPRETRDGQQFVVDVELFVPRLPDSDELGDTLDYADVAVQVERIVTGPAFRLIETVAHRIAERCLAYPGVQATTVTVHKPQAPIPQEVRDLSVTIHRSRDDQRTI